MHNREDDRWEICVCCFLVALCGTIIIMTSDTTTCMRLCEREYNKTVINCTIEKVKIGQTYKLMISPANSSSKFFFDLVRDDYPEKQTLPCMWRDGSIPWFEWIDCNTRCGQN